MRRTTVIYIAIAAAGFTALAAQIIFMREFINFVEGNELVLGVVLSLWLLETGAGARLGKLISKSARKDSVLLILQTAAPLFAFAAIFALRLGWHHIFEVGVTANLAQITAISAVALLPYCLSSGFLFSLFAQLSSGDKPLSKTYYLDALGGALGGFLFSFLIVDIMETFEILATLAILNCVVVFVASLAFSKKYIGAVAAVVLIAAATSVFFNLDDISKGYLFPRQKITANEETPYGNALITKTSGQTNLYLNGALAASSANPVRNEETAHYALAQVENPRNVLLIGGGYFGVVEQILKHKPERLDYLEINVELLELTRRIDAFRDYENVNVISKDARIYLRNPEAKYDAVIINKPPPSTAQTNRYYALDFFESLKKVLTDKGVVSLALPSSGNYLNKEAESLNSIIYSTLRKSFENIILIQGSDYYYIASDSKLSYSIGELIARKNIQTEYVNRYYYDKFSVQFKSDQILEKLNKDAELNRDFQPVAYYEQTNFWLSQFQFSVYWIFAVLLIPLILFAVKFDEATFALFASGFAASSAQVVFLVAFQIIYGYVYLMLGTISAVFMIGLTAGAAYASSRLKTPTARKSLAWLIAASAVFLVVLPPLLQLIKDVNLPISLTVTMFMALTLIFAAIIGAEFTAASEIRKTEAAEAAGALYGADMFGSSIGALLCASLILPVLGLSASCYIAAGFAALSMVGVVLRGRGSIS